MPNLEWDQVNLESGFITVVAQKSKTRRIRRIPLNHSMSELFYRKKRGQVSYFIDGAWNRESVSVDYNP